MNLIGCTNEEQVENLLLYRFVVCEFRGVGMNIIEKFIKVLERYMDNLSIKKNLYSYTFSVFYYR